MSPEWLEIDGENPRKKKSLEGEAPKSEYKLFANLWSTSVKDMWGESQGTQQKSTVEEGRVPKVRFPLPPTSETVLGGLTMSC